MIFLANRANLDRRTLLRRIHDRFGTQVPDAESPVEQVYYETSAGTKIAVHATISPEEFLGTAYPIAEAELQVSFDFPRTHAYDFYMIQWVESDRDLMLGWHQDETHMEIGECHFQIDHRGTTVQRAQADYVDAHPLNVLDRRIDDLVAVLGALTWAEGVPSLPDEAVR